MEPSLKGASARLHEIIRRNRSGERIGLYAVCSAHPSVLAAAVQQAVEDESLLLVESTSSQVNQSGGYTGQNPSQFARFVLHSAQQAGLPQDSVLLGGDHLGPYPWRQQASETAMRNACELVRASVLAGYKKIHLDASMACADDDQNGPDEETIAQRAATLCRVAEDVFDELPPGSSPLVYVVGTEVPAPGGELTAETPFTISEAGQVQRSLELFRAAFAKEGLSPAWERVVGMVVQPGVEFGENTIFDYDRAQTKALSAALPARPALVFEAHSTDYQKATALAEMVEDHFGILKVGPWLTFAFREAVFGLSGIEREWLGRKRGIQLSQVREALDAAMQRNPTYWRSYYHGNKKEVRLARMYSYSDRCRYYWGDVAVQQELARLRANLDAGAPPLTLLSQYLPLEYEAIRRGAIPVRAEDIIQEHIRAVLRIYAEACNCATIAEH